MTKSVFTKEYKFMLEQLVKARKKAGLSQRELSEKLNMPSSFVGKYELGERRLDIIEVLQIAMVLNINTGRLIYEIEKVMNKLTPRCCFLPSEIARPRPVKQKVSGRSK